MTRLVVIDTPLDPSAWGTVPPEADHRASHAVPYAEWIEGTTTIRAIGVDGLIRTPRGTPPVWEPRRRAAGRALAKLAKDADELIVTSDDPLFTTQVRDLVGEGRHDLIRRARRGSWPWDDLTPIDDLAGESRALAEEVAAIVSHLLHRIDPGLGIHETTALDRLALGPRSRAALLREGVPGSSLDRLTEHGYVAEDPAWLSPAGVRLHEVLPPVLADPATATRCDEWIDAVMRGTVDRATARERFLALLDGVTTLPVPPEFDAGRLIGRCPICDEWMAGARGRLRCLGCGHGYLLPGRTEVLAVPGSACPTCDAPLVRPVVHGRVHPVRCPDRAGCPDAMDAAR